MRRHRRLSNGFNRKIENHMATVAINYFAYNFIKIPSSLRTSPPMAAGVTTRLFDVTKETTMKVLFGCGVLAIMIVGATTLAQEESTQPVGSLAALTPQNGGRRIPQTQTQLQGLSVYLSAQQSRLIQTSARVDTIRKDLDIAARDSKTVADRLAAARASLANELDPDLRAQVQDMLTAVTGEATQATAHEAQIRAREAEAFADLQTELTRWSELIARLEQAIRQ